MFNKDFFPTPDWLTEKLMEGISSDKDWRVLEPSAGKGTLVEAAKEIWERKQDGRGRTYDFNVDVIEIEPQLQTILASAGHHLVSDDFLRFNGYVPYDLIIANFPFSEDAKHLEKALDILERNGGELRCITSSWLIENPGSRYEEKVVNRLLAYGPDIEIIHDGRTA